MNERDILKFENENDMAWDGFDEDAMDERELLKEANENGE